MMNQLGVKSTMDDESKLETNSFSIDDESNLRSNVLSIEPKSGLSYGC